MGEMAFVALYEIAIVHCLINVFFPQVKTAHFRVAFYCDQSREPVRWMDYLDKEEVLTNREINLLQAKKKTKVFAFIFLLNIHEIIMVNSTSVLFVFKCTGIHSLLVLLVASCEHLISLGGSLNFNIS